MMSHRARLAGVTEGQWDETSMSDEQRRQRNLRVSDAEREHVVELLQKAIGRGMLDLDEFSERTDTAFAARTRGELNAVLVDLPGLVHDDFPQRSSMPSTAPGAPSADRVELRGQGSTLVRKGHWVVPPELFVTNNYGTTKLDFCAAEIPGQVVHIELDVKWGTVDITVPEQAAVDLNGLTEVKWSTISEKTRSTGISGIPRFVISGRLLGTTLKLRHPRKSWFV